MSFEKPNDLANAYCGALLRFHDYCEARDLNFRTQLMAMVEKRMGDAEPDPTPPPLPIDQPAPPRIPVNHPLVKTNDISRWSPADFGAAVRKMRIARGLNQGTLAARIGMQQSYLCKIEAGKIPTRYKTKQRIYAAMGIPLA